MSDREFDQAEGISKDRTEALSDGIFAFAMTLMVISLVVPPISRQDAAILLPKALASMWGEFLIFVIAFFVIASFWVSHHRIMQRVRFVNDRIISITILFLFFIVLIPFTTALSGDYSEVLVAVILFHANLLVASILLTVLGFYIHHHLADLNPGIEAREWTGRDRALVIPVVTLVAIGVSFVSPQNSFWCYLFIPVILFIIRHGLARKSEFKDKNQ